VAFEQVIRTILTSVFFTVQAASPSSQYGASVILNGSVISVLGNPGYAPTPPARPVCAAWRACSRFGAFAGAHPLNVVAPGAIRTPIWRALHRRKGIRRAGEPHRQTTPLGALVKWINISKTVLVPRLG